MHNLPIDAVLARVVATIKGKKRLVLGAPPGAGKTTRVPRALMEAETRPNRRVVVLEPRRVAARMAARFVAHELGEQVGQAVGYHVRHDRVASDHTRLLFVTEALLLRQLLADPNLRDVGAVVFDEFHERHIAGDVALALVRRLVATTRPDLEIVCMSATLDIQDTAKRLGDWPSLETTGRAHPVEFEYLAQRDTRNLSVQVARAVQHLCAADAEGHLLVFLPGAAEIRAAIAACESISRAQGVRLLPLYGELDIEAQERALAPSAERKAIFATNVAETSLTIDGVAAVIDSGLARIPSVNPWTGVTALEIQPISRASADQRAGRAGRTRPGRCHRLYTRHDYDHRRPYDLPEILRLDLADTALLLRGLGIDDARHLPWLDAPTEASLNAARTLLSGLGAIDAHGALSRVGRQMLELPIHPRLARIVVEAASRGIGREGALAAALLSERTIEGAGQHAKTVAGDFDILHLRDLYKRAEREHFRAATISTSGLNPAAVQAVRTSVDQIAAQAPRSPVASVPSGPQSEEDLLISILAGFPDRVAGRRAGAGARRGDTEYVLANGSRARLAPTSVVTDAPLIVAVDVEDRSSQTDKKLASIRWASKIEPTWLLMLSPDAVIDEVVTEWNPQAERVESWRRTRYAELILEQGRQAQTEPDTAAALLFKQASVRGLEAFAPEGLVEGLRARLEILSASALETAGLLAVDHQAQILESTCLGRQSFAELRGLDWHSMLVNSLPVPVRRVLDAEAPETIALPSGKRLPVHYAGGKPPWVESYLQDFFGMKQAPAIGRGQSRLTIHLWAPSRRPLQVTSDLASFWREHYPKLRNQLMRRYPKHAWPEQPLTAIPRAKR